MISPSSLRSAMNLAAAAADLAQGLAAPAGRSSGTARATYVPSTGNLPTILGKAGGAGMTGARRSSRGTRAALKSRTGRSAGVGYAASKSKAKASAKDPLSFLKDPKLSIEEKLMKLLGYLNAKWEKEMQDKLDKIGKGEAAKTSGTKSSSSKKKGGLLGGIAGAVKSALGPAGIALEALKIPAVRSMLSKIGGPVLAAGASALGFPELAPLLLKHGSKIVEFAAGAVSSLDGGKEGGGSATSTASGGTKAMSDSERQMLVMEIQRIQQKQQEMFGLVSNILKANHDVRSGIIGNIR